METKHTKKYYGSYVMKWKNIAKELQDEVQTLMTANMGIISANAKLVQELGELRTINTDLAKQIATQSETISILLEQVENLKKIKGV